MRTGIENILGHPQEEILIVDDDKLIIKSLEETLKRDDYRIFKAFNGQEAIAMLHKHPVALIICDQCMPGMGGIEVLKKAQEIRPDAIRILLTGSSDLETILQAINVSHVSNFIVKPWEEVLLRKIVSDSIEKYRLKKENQDLQELILEQHKELSEANQTFRHELLLGARIHETLLLGSIPKNFKDLSIAAITIPSKDIDGDFFEFYQPSSKILDVVIGDVMGKGISAALVGTAIKTHLARFAVPFTKSLSFDKQGLWHEDILSPEEIINHLHQEIAPKLLQLEYFVSLFYGRFDLERCCFSYVDCGSTKPIIYNAAQGKVKQLKGINYPIGMMESDQFTLKEEPLEEGDLFIFYSDGVTEARSPDHRFFGEKRLIELIKKYANEEADTLLNHIKHAVVNFTEKYDFDDDLTLIIIKVIHAEVAKKAKTLSAQFRSELSQLKAVRKFVQSCCQKVPGNTKKLANQLQLAINEAFCNIVKHSYGGVTGQNIIIQSNNFEEGILFQLSDQGQVFNPDTIRNLNLTGAQENGFGWYLIQEIADEITYIQKPTEIGWNHLRIFKRYISEEETMEIEHATKNDILIITLEGESLDAKDAPAFKEKVIDLIATNNIKQIVIDLHHLHFIDSSGLGSLLSILRLLNSQGGELKLANVNKSIRTMFELVSMHKIFQIYKNTDDAIQSFK